MSHARDPNCAANAAGAALLTPGAQATPLAFASVAIVVVGCALILLSGCTGRSGDARSAGDTGTAITAGHTDSTAGTAATGAARASQLAASVAAAQLAPRPPTSLTTRMGAQEQAAIAALPAGTGHDLVLANCLTCHSARMIEQQHKDSAGWNKTVSQMMQWGSPLSADQRPVLVAYLAQHFPARSTGARSRSSHSR